MRLARAATISAGLAALALASTASATVRPGDSVVVPTASAGDAIAGARLGSPVDENAEELSRGFWVVIAFLFGTAILIWVTDSESP